MSRLHDTGYPPAHEHEGYSATVLDDGTEAAPGAAELAARTRGWRAACTCGWRGEQLDPVGEQDPAQPPATVDIDTDGTHYLAWTAHLHQVLPELAVHDLILDSEDNRDQLTTAVAAARAAGASWERIGAAAGISRQAAHERWSSMVSGTPREVVEDRPLGMKRLAYLRLRDLLRHRDHQAQQRWGQALKELPSSPAAAEHHEAALTVARAEAEARTWQAAEQLLTEFYQRESRAQ